MTTTLISMGSDTRPAFLDAVLEDSEFGLAVIDASGTAEVRYLNATARRLLETDAGLPLAAHWTALLAPMLDRIWHGGIRVVDRWVLGELVLRVNARPLDRSRELVALEITVERAPGAGNVQERLVRSLGLSLSDARLLAFLWRGMSNDDIATTMSVRLGTVKSRLFRLYQRLGVSKRSTAVLRAAEVLQEPPAAQIADGSNDGSTVAPALLAHA